MFCEAWSLGERRFWMRLVDSLEGGMEFWGFGIWFVLTISVLSLGLLAFLDFFFRGSELEDD